MGEGARERVVGDVVQRAVNEVEGEVILRSGMHGRLPLLSPSAPSGSAGRERRTLVWDEGDDILLCSSFSSADRSARGISGAPSTHRAMSSANSLSAFFR